MAFGRYSKELRVAVRAGSACARETTCPWPMQLPLPWNPPPPPLHGYTVDALSTRAPPPPSASRRLDSRGMRAPRRRATTATAKDRDASTRPTPSASFTLPRRTRLASRDTRAPVWGLFMCLPERWGTRCERERGREGEKEGQPAIHGRLPVPTFHGGLPVPTSHGGLPVPTYGSGVMMAANRKMSAAVAMVAGSPGAKSNRST
jgi:hypothetical protein